MVRSDATIVSILQLPVALAWLISDNLGLAPTFPYPSLSLHLTLFAALMCATSSTNIRASWMKFLDKDLLSQASLPK